ncbi:ser/Thr protein phosphatase [Whalleya microplaca]|nr:ser/Thr protein phosphatase [Whalleya microplaca]
MDLTPAKIAISILKHHGVSTCIVGELALNYYNVPRVCHDVEICVPKSGFLAAAGFLCSTGLFEPSELENDFNNYTEYKRGSPRVRTTGWIYPPQNIVIFPTALFGLDPIERILISPQSTGQKAYFSKEISDLSQEDVANMPLPRLPPLLRGLAKRFLDTSDDVAMIAVEQLVDGMNLDEAWTQKNLEGSDAALMALIMNQIHSKKSRIDYFSDNKVTCFISGEEEAENERLNDAAIALHRVLSRERINFGIFGGYAIAAIGGVRESKDVDCLASVSKAQVIQLLDGKEGFQAIPQSRQDFVAFFWSDKPDRRNAVLVEIFREQFPARPPSCQGPQYSMGDIQCSSIQVQGLTLGQGNSSFLDPFYLFKGKLRAAATRAKFHDAADLRMLAGRHEQLIKSHVGELSLEYLGIDVDRAKQVAVALDPNKLPPPAPGDVQRGLLG